MTLDYFYGAQADQFTFYRIPKALFVDKRFKPISAEAKILYGILLDRMSLSRKNGWLDEADRVFIIFTLEEVMEAIGCADQKATKLLNELESKAGLIERKRQGLGRPNLIYVKNFMDTSEGDFTQPPESRIKSRENHDSGTVEITIQESRKSQTSNTDSNKQQLDNNVFQASSIAQKYNCQLTCLDFRQEEGLMSSLPLGLNQIEIQRGMTTSSVAIFVPFTTQELFQSGKSALYCGINALSNNLIMVDRKLLKNPNGLILGTPGSGKSFAAKREIANVFCGDPIRYASIDTNYWRKHFLQFGRLPKP